MLGFIIVQRSEASLTNNELAQVGPSGSLSSCVTFGRSAALTVIHRGDRYGR